MIWEFLGLALVVALCGSLQRAVAQQESETPADEIVVNQAAGRVVIAVVKDAIVIGTVENPIEAETHVPAPVALSGRRAGIILGAVDWFSPSSQLELARLDKELPRLRSRLVPSGPHLGPGTSAEATDIEATGQALLERLNEVAKGLHSNVDWPEDQPLAELIIADYLEGYGPEVWQLTYGMQQEPEHGEYWDTRILRPRYLQFWPPEKGQPHTLLEFDYPRENVPPTLLDLLRQKDPRLEKIVTSDAKMAEVADQFLAGQSGKVLAADATQFLRAALAAIAPPKARQTMALIGVESGFDWILRPPPEPKGLRQEKQRPPGAPSLIKPPSTP